VSTRSKVSLELVGEFFEVRTQVDRDLTTVSRVDRRLGLIKNLGRHSPTGPSARRDRPARPLPCHARSQRRKSRWRGGLERGKEFLAGSGDPELVEACSKVAAAPWLAVAPTGAAAGVAPGRRPEGERAADATMPCAPASDLEVEEEGWWGRGRGEEGAASSRATAAED
jgi:hypothetical protein